MIKVEGQTNRLQCNRLYLSLSIPSTFSRCGMIVSCNRIQARVPAYQVFRKLVNCFPRCRVARRHDPRLCIQCPHQLFSISLNPMTPDPIILFKLLVQLQGLAIINAQVSTMACLTSIHSCHSIDRIPIVTLRRISGHLRNSQLTTQLTGRHPT